MNLRPRLMVVPPIVHEDVERFQRLNAVPPHVRDVDDVTRFQFGRLRGILEDDPEESEVERVGGGRQHANGDVPGSGLGHVEFRKGLAEQLPVEDGWADAVISNGVINLCADKRAVFDEIRRVLRPGGVLLFAGEPSRHGDRIAKEQQ